MILRTDLPIVRNLIDLAHAFAADSAERQQLNDAAEVLSSLYSAADLAEGYARLPQHVRQLLVDALADARKDWGHRLPPS